MDKEEYFRQLCALNENSDSEEDINEARDILRQSERPPNSPPSFSSLSPIRKPILGRRGEQPKLLAGKVPGIHRTTSAPVQSSREVSETSQLPRIQTLLRYDISATSFTEREIQETPPTTFIAKSMSERSVSTPNIGSVVMKNSTGIKSMLRKRKRKDELIKLVPENRRIFSNQTFFYIPPDDIAKDRRLRINRARSFGVEWTKEWVPGITHVVVDNEINFQDVSKFFKNTLKIDSIPPGTILVNEEYPLDCIEFCSLVDPNQPKYAVLGCETPYAKDVVQTTLHVSQASFKLKPSKPKKGGNGPIEQTPSHSQSSIQKEGVATDAASSYSPGLWLPGILQEPKIVESPEETADTSSNLPGLLNEGDELDGMIEAALKLIDIPLSDDEDDRPSSRDNLENSGGADGEEARVRARPVKRKRKSRNKGSHNQDNFTCMKGGGTADIPLESNPNLHTINLLEELGKYYDRIGDQWRTRAYRVAVGVLKKESKKISTYDEAVELLGIGDRIANKIEEIVVTKHLRRLEYALAESGDQVLQLFLGIYGVGIQQARQFIQQGYKSLDDLKMKAHLSKGQQIGIDHYADFNTRIPREEVTTLGEVVKKEAASIDPQVEAIIGGSYRRGAKTSGDIDFLITKPGTTTSNELMPFLDELVSRLTESKFLVAALATPHSSSEGSKWHGACVLPGDKKAVWRRIDLLLVPESEFGAALIYFTGDDIFNRSMRLLSSKKGMRLNQRGLYKDVMRGPGRVKLNEGSLVEGRDERAIFEALGVPWRPPEERICH